NRECCTLAQEYEITLENKSPEQLAILQDFQLPEEQKQFTSLPKDALPVTAGQHPLVIVRDGEPVGFFILNTSDRVKEYTHNPVAMLLTSFLIDYKQQENGYASRFRHSCSRSPINFCKSL